MINNLQELVICTFDKIHHLNNYLQELVVYYETSPPYRTYNYKWSPIIDESPITIIKYLC